MFEPSICVISTNIKHAYLAQQKLLSFIYKIQHRFDAMQNLLYNKQHNMVI